MSESANRNFNFFSPPRFCVLLALLIFTSFPEVLLGIKTFVVRDFGFFVYPLAYFQRECFWHGEIPFWNPYNYCGIPFLAQWNTMPLYPPSLIYLVLPLTWALGFFTLLHLWFAGIGMYFLARRWTQNDLAAAFAGTVFALNGFTLNLLMWPSHLATLAWMPWVVLAVEIAWREGGRKIFLAALVGAMQMLAGGPEIISFTWVFLAVLWLQQFFEKNSPRVKMFWRSFFVIALVTALAAAQLFPFLDLVAHSQRDTHYLDTRWSLPWHGFANFLVPMAFGGIWDMGVFFQYDQQWTSSYYTGTGALVLAIFALWKIRERRVWLLGAALAAALIFALGENTLVIPSLRNIFPLFKIITHSIKYLAVFVFVVPLLSAFALAKIQNGNEKKSGAPKSILLVSSFLLALIGVILFCAWKFPFPTDDVHRTLLNGFSRAGFLILTGVLIFFIASKMELKIQRVLPLLLIFAAWLDVFTHEPPQNPTVAPWIYQPDLQREKLALRPQPALGQSREMISPQAYYTFLGASISMQNDFLVKRIAGMANCNLLDHAPKTDGFLSLCPREADDVNTLLYERTNANFPKLEDFMGVSQITSTQNADQWIARDTFLPLVTAGQKPYFFDDFSACHALSQTNFYPDKLVILTEDATNFVTVSNQTSAKILDSKFENNSVEIHAEASEPSLVVIAQTYYHDWRASVDGQPTKLLRANYAFDAVQIPAGKHEIRLVYRDLAFEIGAAISLLALAFCIGAMLIRRRA